MDMNWKLPTILTIAGITALFLLIFGSKLYTTVQPGHVSVATLFGDVQDKIYSEGLHFPVNPFYNFVEYDVRQKTIKEEVNVPSQDQLNTQIDVSVQYRLEASQVPTILRETGRLDDVLNVHLIPKLRSSLREQGKTVPRAEDFFTDKVLDDIQANLISDMRTFMQPRGVEIQDVLIREIKLPPFILRAIESKKEREQEAEKQKAELDRFRTEQEQKVVSAQAERQSAEEEAEKKKVLADAQAYEIQAIADARAYEIQKINEAIADNPAYIKLEAMNTLKKIAEDPAAKLYFLDGDSPAPLPLMNIGNEPVMGGK